VLPTFEGSQVVYLRILRPFFKRNYKVIDPWVEKAEQQVESAVVDTIEQAERGAAVARRILKSDVMQEAAEQLQRHSPFKDVRLNKKTLKQVAVTTIQDILDGVGDIAQMKNKPQVDVSGHDQDTAPAAE